MWLGQVDLDGAGNLLLGLSAILGLWVAKDRRKNGKLTEDVETLTTELEDCKQDRDRYRQQRDQARGEANELRRRVRGRGERRRRS